MLERKGNIWDQVGHCTVVCITTNGFVKSSGAAVMGRGCAREAIARYPGIEKFLGRKINEEGNIPHLLAWESLTAIFSFPVKPVSAMCLPDKSNVVRHMRWKFNPGELVPGWACMADIDIIRMSAKYLVSKIGLGDGPIVLPRPGCGAGELDWKDVKPVLEEIFDNRFVCYSF